MYISEVYIYFFDGLAVDSRTETEHTVCSRVLRPYIDHKVVWFKNSDFFLFNSPVGLFAVAHG